jgi:hypothetical protein
MRAAEMAMARQLQWVERPLTQWPPCMTVAARAEECGTLAAMFRGLADAPTAEAEKEVQPEAGGGGDIVSPMTPASPASSLDREALVERARYIAQQLREFAPREQSSAMLVSGADMIEQLLRERAPVPSEEERAAQKAARYWMEQCFEARARSAPPAPSPSDAETRRMEAACAWANTSEGRAALRSRATPPAAADATAHEEPAAPEQDWADDLAHKLDEDHDADFAALLRARLGGCVKALETVEHWKLPELEDNGKKLSYGAAYGSKGERSYLQVLARAALAQLKGKD